MNNTLHILTIAVATSITALTVTSQAALLVNGGNDLALVGGEIPGWTEIVGVNWTQRATSPTPQAGSQYFNPGAGANAELAQTVDVSVYAAYIDAGFQQFEFSGYVSGWSSSAGSNSDLDTAQIIVEFWDVFDTGTLLDFYDSGAASYNYLALDADTGSQWAAELTDSRLAPSGTREIRVRLIAERFNGTNNDGFFDSLELTTFSTIPEPSTLALLGAGLGMLMAARRGRR